MAEPQQSSSTSEYTKPPSQKETREDPAPTLSWIDDRLAKLYRSVREGKQPPLLNRDEYLDLYTAVHSLMIAILHRRSGKARKDRDGDVDVDYQDLYSTLVRQVRAHCRETRAAILAASSADGADEVTARRLIAECNTRWSAFVQLAGVVANVMQYLERHWVIRELDERKGKGDKGGIYLLRELHEVVWREEVLKVTRGGIVVEEGGEEEIGRAVRVLREREGKGDREVVDEFEGSLEVLGVGSSLD